MKSACLLLFLKIIRHLLIDSFHSVNASFICNNYSPFYPRHPLIVFNEDAIAVWLLDLNR